MNEVCMMNVEVSMKPNPPKAVRISALALLLFFAACGSGMAETGEGDGRFVISPPYTPAPEVVPNYEIPQGTLHEFTMNSADSAIFPKDVATGQTFTRSVAVYVPAQYQAGTEAPFMVVQDGVSYFLSSGARARQHDPCRDAAGHDRDLRRAGSQ